MKIEDPLNAIEDLRKGILKSPTKEAPMKKDFFRVFRYARISAQYSFKISPFMVNFIKENSDQIKVKFCLKN